MYIRVVVMTQCAENYGAHDWNGVGQCPQYWKMKGGNEYIARISRKEIESRGLSEKTRCVLAHKAVEKLMKNSEASHEWVIRVYELHGGEQTDAEMDAAEHSANEYVYPANTQFTI